MTGRRRLEKQLFARLPFDGYIHGHNHNFVFKETATPELRIPETLQDSLMGRLDALGPVKELAQIGSVLGREFSYELLLEVSPQSSGLVKTHNSNTSGT